MRTHILYPSEQLAPFVENYVDLGVGTPSLTTPHVHRLLPAPGTSIAIGYGSIQGSAHYEGKEECNVPVCSVAGYWTRPKSYALRGEGGVFVVCFKPWGLSRFTPLDLRTTTDRNVDLRHAFGDPITNELRDRIAGTRDVRRRRSIVEEILLRILRERDERAAVRERRSARRGVQLIAESGGTIRVGQLADELGLGGKRLDRIFAREIGMTPKRMARVIRFQRSLQVLQHSTSLAEATYELGYFDQAHFIREFRGMAGNTPGAWLSKDRTSELGKVYSRSLRSSNLYNTIYE